ncbi:TPA: lectin [Enterococcus faecalis]|nr:lectin [Enterococcus faecalis]
MKPSKLGGLFFLLSYLLLFFGGLFFFPGEGLAAIIEPAFETLPIDQTMISTVGKAGSPSGSENHRYVQINDTTPSSSGAVWFNNPVSFTNDFKIEMAFYIENVTNDSDGLTFVMQSNGPTAIAEEAGPTIGVWANTGDSTPLSKGAIPNSLAIEFDTFYNNNSNLIANDGMMDRDTSSKGHHIAWAYPGAETSYTKDGIFKIDKVLHHRNEKGVTDLSDSKWHKFIVEFKREAGTFTYSVPDYALNITIPVDTEFKNNLGLNENKRVYFGFTGANGGYAQAKAISFTNVEGLVDLQLRTGVAQSADNQLLADTGIPQNEVHSVDRSQEITYMTAIDYLQTSDLLRLQAGTRIQMTLPDNFEVLENKVYFGSAQEIGTGAQPTGGQALPFTREKDKIVITLPALERGTLYGLYFKVKNKLVQINSLLDLTVPVSSTFSGNAFSKPVTTGDPAVHYYKLTGKWMPTITTGHSSATEAAQSPQIVRQKRKAYLPVQIEDENSTSTKLFMSPIVSEEELATTTFIEKAHLSRENLTENFETTIEYETSQLQPEKMYYVGMYTVDAEGNQSETKIQAIDFKGIIELTTVPTAFVGNTLTINELVQTKREDGYFYMKIENLPENDSLTITNTSSYSWELSGQLATIVEQLESWGQEVSLCFFEKNTQTLLFQLTKDEQLILKQEVEGKDVTKSLNDYDLYFRFKADPLKVVPGRYSGNVRWRLSEVKP